jgi:hypothetical protein
LAEAVLQILMEADVEGLIGAKRHERTGDRKRRVSRLVAEQWYIRPTRLSVRQGGCATMMSRLKAISPWQRWRSSAALAWRGFSNRKLS